jgi:hypothetical protein
MKISKKSTRAIFCQPRKSDMGFSAGIALKGQARGRFSQNKILNSTTYWKRLIPLFQSFRFNLYCSHSLAFQAYAMGRPMSLFQS